MDPSDFGLVLVDETGQPVHRELAVYPENQTPWSVFRRCATQWQYHPLTGERVGLRYEGVRAVVGMTDTPENAELLDQLRWLELGALGQQPEIPELDQIQSVFPDLPQLTILDIRAEEDPHG